MACISVVRIGPSSENVSAKLLRNALVSYIEKQSTTSSNMTQLSDTNTLTISNKYFTASVLLGELGVLVEEQCMEDGVILVFDGLRSNPDLSSGDGASFDSLSFAHQQAEEKDTCGDLLRLCVGISLSDLSPSELRGKKHEAEYSRRILWCLDRGYEYVECDLSREGQAKGHDDRDKDGFARIVEAIQGTVWSSAVMSKSKTKELKESYQEDIAAMEKQKEEEEEENLYEPPDPSKFELQPKKEEADTEGNILSEESTADVAGLLLDPENVGPEEMKQLRNDMEAEHHFDKMDSVLKEAQSVREASKSGMLPDDERRQRAGDAAMALMNLMDQFDEKSEGDLSDDDSGVHDD
jgi:hypothetical protein